VSKVIDSLSVVRDLTGEEVFEIWRQNEEHLPHWQAYWGDKGFSSWEEWRHPYADALKLNEQTWKLYRVNDALNTVTQFRGGPFGSWIDTYYADRVMPTFAELAHSEALQELIDREGRITNFPQRTTLTGLVVGDDVIIIEGMHRAVALAIAHERGAEVQSEILIALAEASPEEIPERLASRENSALHEKPLSRENK
jgi:hypothetical protein